MTRVMKGFASFHPAVLLGFFVCAVVLTVLANRPALQAAGVVCAATFYLCVRGRSGWKTVAALVPAFVVLALANPLFSTQGDTVLFTWLGGRPYTLEALVFGASTSAMFVGVLLWFFSYNHVMTSDRFTYLFGRLAPALALVFTMVLRLVPTYQRKARDIAGARACVGHGASQGGLRERTQAGATLLSALVGWALEGSVVTADSMRSRGFGTGRRTAFARYRFGVRDGCLAAVLALLFAGAAAGVVSGALSVDYFPTIAAPDASPLVVVGSACFVAFLVAPAAIDLWEAASWRISLSKA